MTRTRHAAAALLAVALTATACGSGDAPRSDGLEDRIEVSGQFGERPEISVETPLELTESVSWTAEEGDGDEVGAQATTILQLTLANGRTGKTVVSTLDEGQRPQEIRLGDQVFPSLNAALVGQSADSRVVVASTAEDAYGDNGAPQIGIEGGDPVVMVVDILSTDPTTVLEGPTGPEVEPPATAPTLLEEGGRPVGFDFTGLKKPAKLMVVPLREGDGPVVEDPDRITANYLGQVWGGEKPFEETFTREPASFSIGLSGVIRAWDRGLAGQKEGARVMLVAPPALAYGPQAQGDIPADSTLVFVVDILGVG